VLHEDHPEPSGSFAVTRWFGAPWPSAELRAPVCEDETDHVDTPVGVACAWCDVEIQPGDQGVIIPYLGDFIGKGDPYHNYCFLASVLGEEAARKIFPGTLPRREDH
jgi:hypothetical protein